MAVVKIKNEKVQKSVPSKENLNLKKKCELPDASYSVSNIQDLSAYIL